MVVIQAVDDAPAGPGAGPGPGRLPRRAAPHRVLVILAYSAVVLALLLVALSLSLSSFAAAIGIGVAGTCARTRLQAGIVLGMFEDGMPVLGLVPGPGPASTLGPAARRIGAALLIAADGYALIQALRGSGGKRRRCPGVAGSAGWRSPGSR